MPGTSYNVEDRTMIPQAWERKACIILLGEKKWICLCWVDLAFCVTNLCWADVAMHDCLRYYSRMREAWRSGSVGCGMTTHTHTNTRAQTLFVPLATSRFLFVFAFIFYFICFFFPSRTASSPPVVVSWVVLVFSWFNSFPISFSSLYLCISCFLATAEIIPTQH